MKLILRYLLFSFLIPGFLSGCSGNGTQKSADEPKVDVTIVQSWHGNFPVAQLELLPEAQRDSPVGYIDDEVIFKRIWSAFKPGEATPQVDFSNNLVVYVRNTQFYNILNIGKVTVEKGVAEVLAMETLSAMPIEDKVAMSLAEIPRKGITGLKSRDQVIPIPSR